ncbi:unnamed protein product [Pieris macdunnoughi]|uniref:Uncharacterized protein n=1 Tax=Pieris macdunnoughi TaxID=345717 RepID=A0A821W1X2_9NEOP|nr:unnamed protein product [Pieris macdunnoughi]
MELNKSNIIQRTENTATLIFFCVVGLFCQGNAREVGLTPDILLRSEQNLRYPLKPPRVVPTKPHQSLGVAFAFYRNLSGFRGSPTV